MHGILPDGSSLIAFVIAQDVLGLSAVQPLDPAEYIHHLATLTARGLNAKPSDLNT